MFYNPENGFHVLIVNARGYQSLITVTGNTTTVNEGETVTITGKWRNHKRFGRQFVADLIQSTVPQTNEGMRKYLSSKAIDGVGAVYAEKLVSAFGDKLFNIIQFEPERLRDIDGIGPKRAQQIKDAWDRHHRRHEAMLFLHEHGIGMARAVKIYKTYQTSTVGLIVNNPYRLISDFSGIGFKIADALAMKIGFATDDIRRVRAGLRYLISEATAQGSCGVAITDLLDHSTSLLEIDEQLAKEAIEIEFKEHKLIKAEIDGIGCVFSIDLFWAEEIVSKRIKVLQNAPLPWREIDCNRALAWVETENRIQLSDSQARAVMLAVSEKFTIITGGPGVGKTTIVNTILKILNAVKVKIKMCAPTGRAAKRMTEATGQMAFTIHRLLAFDSNTRAFQHNSENPLKCDLLIVDEASMVDVKLMSALLEAINEKAAVIIVGDVDQLPSIGPGRVLGDIIDSESVPVARLTEVFRQVTTSKIITYAHQINAGLTPEFSHRDDNNDFYFIPAEDPEDAVGKVLKLVCDRIPAKFELDPVRDIQVLCPMIRGTVGVQALNEQLRDILNPGRSPNGSIFAVGDKVMQIKNNYEASIFNGDIGYVAAVNPSEKPGESLIEVDFEGRLVELGADDFDGLMSAYAVTIHKSQGSEFPAVVIPIMKQHYVMLRRKLLYTGVTRGKQLVVLVGQKAAIQMAIYGQDSKNARLTRLKNLLK